MRCNLTILLPVAVFMAAYVHAEEPEGQKEGRGQAIPVAVPDIREDEMTLKVQKGDFVVVPIPMSNPTLGTGLVLGGAYFYSQTEEQAASQPASLTGAAGMYTANDSKAFGIGQQNYWDGNNWRFSGILAYAALRLELLSPEVSGARESVNWLLRGSILQAKFSRRIKGHWYAGIKGQYLEISQRFSLGDDEGDFDVEPDSTAWGLGISAEYDSRDSPYYSTDGITFSLEAMYKTDTLSDVSSYKSYSSNIGSYHQLSDSTVLAWELRGCSRTETAPLWDSCTIKLRGFAATDYLGKNSGSGQVEARWKFSPRWGAVVFAGVGYITNSFSESRDREAIPSYGGGIRFTVLKSKGINMRLDYGRSVDSDAVYLSVGEAF